MFWSVLRWLLASVILIRHCCIHLLSGILGIVLWYCIFSLFCDMMLNNAGSLVFLNINLIPFFILMWTFRPIRTNGNIKGINQTNCNAPLPCSMCLYYNAVSVLLCLLLQTCFIYQDKGKINMSCSNIFIVILLKGCLLRYIINVSPCLNCMSVKIKSSCLQKWSPCRLLWSHLLIQETPGRYPHRIECLDVIFVTKWSDFLKNLSY